MFKKKWPNAVFLKRSNGPILQTTARKNVSPWSLRSAVTVVDSWTPLHAYGPRGAPLQKGPNDNGLK